MKSRAAHRPRRPFRLTEIEKLDGRHPGLLFYVKAWFDQGMSSTEVAGLIQEKLHVPVSVSAVERYRGARWVPEKELKAIKIVTIKAAVEAMGGDAGLDAAILAKLWELMDQMTVSQLISARTLFIKIRAQNLKEQEFLYKTGQLKPGGEQEVDRETQQRNVLRRVKEIFGLADDDEPEVRPPRPENSAAPPVDSPVAAASTEVARAAESRKGGASAPPLGMPQ